MCVTRSVVLLYARKSRWLSRKLRHSSISGLGHFLLKKYTVLYARALTYDLRVLSLMPPSSVAMSRLTFVTFSLVVAMAALFFTHLIVSSVFVIAA